MVRERVKNRVFTDVFLLRHPLDNSPLPLSALYPHPNPLEVDIGCGRGRFLLARALGNPGVNFLGIDHSLLRLQKIDRKAVAAGVRNILLVNDDAVRAIPCLPAGSVSTVYVFFPDPWPKRRHHSRRLVCPGFIDLVFQALRPGGEIHLCTDHADYFLTITRCWAGDRRFRPIEPFVPSDEEETDFGLIFKTQNRPAHRCSFRKEPIQGS
ncbi:MAG: tRNA (guanine(46)-N(7))-methyltransferase TrmB [bacterium]